MKDLKLWHNFEKTLAHYVLTLEPNMRKYFENALPKHKRMCFWMDYFKWIRDKNLTQWCIIGRFWCENIFEILFMKELNIGHEGRHKPQV